MVEIFVAVGSSWINSTGGKMEKDGGKIQSKVRKQKQSEEKMITMMIIATYIHYIYCYTHTHRLI